MNLLIVDDEYYSVEGIHRKIAHANLGLDNIFCAYSSAQAQACINENAIHIMITDIEMPKGNGLELAAWAREHVPVLICIFLTSFAKFDYASTAVKLQSFDYLLKPVEEAKLLDCVERAILRAQQLEAEQEQKTHARYWRNAQVHLAEQFWADLVNGIIPSNHSIITSELSHRNLYASLAEGLYYPIILRCLPQEGDTGWNRTLFEFALKNILSEILFDANPMPFITRVLDGYYLIVLRAGFDRERLASQCQRALAACTGSLPGRFCFYLKTDCDIESMATVVRQMLLLARNRLDIQNGINDLLVPHQERNEIATIPTETWVELLLAQKTDLLNQAAGAYLTTLRRAPSANRQDLIRFHHDFLQIIYTVMDKSGAAAHQLFDAQLPEIPVDNIYDSVEHMSMWVDSALANFRLCVTMLSNASHAVNEVCRYIREHLAEDLSRDSLAAKVFLSPDHLSHLFREKTGDSLTNYITDQRIRHAKALLLTRNISIRDIALMSGFQNISYFAKQFKRATGKTPQAYRKAP